MKKDIQELLQLCLEGYDAGLSPEECLSAYPHARAELEPLFRQALSLRVAYAAAPSPEFRFRAREKLLFAAGREVKAALEVEPDPQFVDTTRQRLLNTAGAAMQEALRDVPPPRLPFWANARRRLLENASVNPPQPAHAVAVGLRSALSAAVIVVAVAVAGAAFFLQNSPANEPPRSATLTELDEISDEVAIMEQLRARGETGWTPFLDDIAERTSRLAEQSAASPDAELAEKLPDLIQRQQELARSVPLDESVAIAQERLAEADQAITSAAANEPEPTNTPDTPAVTAPTSVATEEPSLQPTQTPEPTTTLPDVTLVEPEDLEPNRIAVQLNPDETALGLTWLQVTTSTATFIMPDAWDITGLDVDGNGRAFFPVPLLVINTDAGLQLLVRMESGEILTSVNGQTISLRAEGVDGSILSPQSLVEIVEDDSKVAALYNMLDSFKLVGDDTGETDSEASEEATPEASETP